MNVQLTLSDLNDIRAALRFYLDDIQNWDVVHGRYHNYDRVAKLESRIDATIESCTIKAIAK